MLGCPRLWQIAQKHPCTHIFGFVRPCLCTNLFQNFTQGRYYVNLFVCNESASQIKPSRKNEPKTKKGNVHSKSPLHGSVAIVSGDCGLLLPVDRAGDVDDGASQAHIGAATVQELLRPSLAAILDLSSIHQIFRSEIHNTLQQLHHLVCSAGGNTSGSTGNSFGLDSFSSKGTSIR